MKNKDLEKDEIDKALERGEYVYKGEYNIE